MLRRWWAACFLPVLVLLAVARLTPTECLADSGVSFARSAATIETERGQFPIVVEIADTVDRRAQGLQGRRQLAADAGMLFNFNEPRPVTMWMKNTFIPLDMIFLDEAGVVFAIAEHTVPQSLTLIPSGRPAFAVLEVNAGTADRLHLRPGDRLRHPIFRDK